MNNIALHPRTGDFIKDTLELLSDSLCIYPKNKQSPKILCFRNVRKNSSRVSSINPIANSRKFSYTKNTPLRLVIFRKDTCPISYKENPLIRDLFGNSIRLASVMKYPLKGIEATNLNKIARSKGVQS